MEEDSSETDEKQSSTERLAAQNGAPLTSSETVPVTIRTNETSGSEEENVRPNEATPRDETSITPSDTQTEEKSVLAEDISRISGLTDAAEQQDGDFDQTSSVFSTEKGAVNSDRTSLGFDLAQKADDKNLDYQMVSTVEIKSVLPIQTTEVILQDGLDDETRTRDESGLSDFISSIRAGISEKLQEPTTSTKPVEIYITNTETMKECAHTSALSAGPSPVKSYPDTGQEEQKDDQFDKEANKSELSVGFTPSIPLESEALIVEIVESRDNEGDLQTSTADRSQEVKSYIVEEALSRTLMAEDVHAFPPDFTSDVSKDSGPGHEPTEKETFAFTDLQSNTGDPARISQDTKMESEEDIDKIIATENRAASVHLSEAEQMSIDSESLRRLQTSFENSNLDIQDIEMAIADNRSQTSDKIHSQFSDEPIPSAEAHTSMDVEHQESAGFAEDESRRPVEGYVTPNIYEEYERQRKEHENQYEELDLSDTSENECVGSGQNPSLYTGQEHQQRLGDSPKVDQLAVTQFPEERKQTSTLTYQLMQEQEDIPVYRQTGQLEYYTQSKPLLHRALKATDVSKSAEKLYRDDSLLDESDDDACYYGEKIVRIVDLTGDGDIKAGENVFGADGSTCSSSDVARPVVPLDHAESLTQIDLERSFAGTKARSEDVIGHQRLRKKESKIFRLLVALRLKRRAQSAADQDQHGQILEIDQRQKETLLIGPETPINERGQSEVRGEAQVVEAKPSRWQRIRERPAREQPEVTHNHRVSLRDRLMGCLCITS